MPQAPGEAIPDTSECFKTEFEMVLKENYLKIFSA
jgi:hypothetical protein